MDDGSLICEIDGKHAWIRRRLGILLSPTDTFASKDKRTSKEGAK